MEKIALTLPPKEWGVRLGVPRNLFSSNWSWVRILHLGTPGTCLRREQGVGLLLAGQSSRRGWCTGTSPLKLVARVRMDEQTPMCNTTSAPPPPPTPTHPLPSLPTHTPTHTLLLVPPPPPPLLFSPLFSPNTCQERHRRYRHFGRWGCCRVSPWTSFVELGRTQELVEEGNGQCTCSSRAHGRDFFGVAGLTSGLPSFQHSAFIFA